MIRLSKTLFSTTILLSVLAGCHSSMNSQATTLSRPQSLSTPAPGTSLVSNPQPVPELGTAPVSQQQTATPPTVAAQSGTVQPVNEVKSSTAHTLPDNVDAVNYKIANRLDSLMQDPFLQKSQMGIYIYDLTLQSPLFEVGKTQSMRPASTMKVITAVTALSQLGTEYQYTTGLYINGTVQKKVLNGSVYIKGGFDPLTGKETVRDFVNALNKKGIQHIKGNIVLDLTMKEDKEAGWGWCWDDNNPCMVPLLYQEKPTFGVAFEQALRNRGIRLSGHVENGRVPQHAELVKEYHTSIDLALKPMMKMSVNLVAESMFYQIAAQLGKPYVTHRTGAAYVKQFIRERLHLAPENYRIADGSGLSLYNYITPELLVEALKYAYQEQDIYRHLLPALPIAGEDGTLKDRMRFTPAHGNVCAKTGTVTGICSLAGYATAKNGHRLCFAIINQGQMKGTEARIFQDKVCCIMTE